MGMALVLVLVHLLPESTREQGIYLWDAPQRGEPWRWLTAHFIHRSSLHLVANLLSWALAALFLSPLPSASRPSGWGIPIAGLAISVSLAVDPAGRDPFVGSSALLYAWLVAGGLRGALAGPRRALYGVALALILVKAVLETIGGDGLGFGELMPAGNVALRAHLHALGWGLLWGGCARFTSSREPGG